MSKASPVVLKGKARAKINLDLRVGERRSDSYHNVDTLFARIGLYDTVVVTNASPEVDGEGIKLVLQGDAGGADGATNLAYRAAELLRETTGRKDSLHISLTKRIPTGAGLGGGSADAATTLRLVNTLWGQPLDDKTLVALGGSLGADIPFLTSDAPAAFGTGRGDVIEPVDLPVGGVVLLALPRLQVGTVEAYGKLAERRVKTGPPTRPALSPRDFTGWHSLAPACVNDFEEPVHEMFPELLELHDTLGQVGAIMARMSGSGAAHFAVFDQKETADAAMVALGAAYPSVDFLVTHFE